nr:MFS transporter [Sphingomonas sp. CDS-1]
MSPTTSFESAEKVRPGLLAPLATPVFLRIWVASMFSNTGLLIQGVGAAWAMVRLSGNNPVMVTLVQTALFLPIMLLSMVAGAIADAMDKRKVALVALGISVACASALAGLAIADVLDAALLLLFSFGIGIGTAIFGPTWQAAVSEQVPPRVLAQAVALNSISFNLARSIGPAVGGAIVALGGTFAVFSINALFYLPMIAVLLLWRERSWTPGRLPPERTGRAVRSGLRFIAHSPPVRTVLIRAFAIAVPGSSVSALMPLIAHERLGAGAQTFGILLGAIGIGAIVGGTMVGYLRNRFAANSIAAVCSFVYGTCVMALAFIQSLALIMPVLMVAGTVWMVTITQFNIIAQLSAPRWVLGRVLAAYQAIIAGGLAFGSVLWGSIAHEMGVANAVLISGIAIFMVPLLFHRLRLTDVTDSHTPAVELGDLDVAVPLQGRSGPIAIEIEYDVNPESVVEFYHVMMEVERVRARNGAHDWFMARNISDERLWVERFQCPSWHDYLRLRDRNSQAEIDVMRQAIAFDRRPGGIVIRRWLVQPFGAVRWRQNPTEWGPTGISALSPGL